MWEIAIFDSLQTMNVVADEGVLCVNSRGGCSEQEPGTSFLS